MDKKIKIEYLEHYDRINKLFKQKFGYDLFFIGGNLLGLIRSGDLLDNDYDMDVAYLSKYSKIEDVKKEYFNIVKELIKIGEDIEIFTKKKSTRKGYFWWKFNSKNRIDVMVYWWFNGKLYRPTFVEYDGNLDIILPLKECILHGYKVLIPNKPEEKLSNVYGKEWRIPDNNFKKIRSDNLLKMIKKISFNVNEKDEIKKLYKL